ncbi:hypothetical protein LG21E20_00200 [Lactococcus formosensis]|nr:hypothetical protein LG21E20_00200 [Lactococcus formosensis]BDX23943.1 hypothetical protein LFMS200408A_00200 [Lactococcus formosensis]
MGRYFKLIRYDISLSAVPKKGTKSDKSDTLKGEMFRNAKVGNNKEKVRIVGKCRNFRTS